MGSITHTPNTTAVSCTIPPENNTHLISTTQHHIRDITNREAGRDFTMLEVQKMKSIVQSTKQKKYILTLISKTF